MKETPNQHQLRLAIKRILLEETKQNVFFHTSKSAGGIRRVHFPYNDCGMTANQMEKYFYDILSKKIQDFRIEENLDFIGGQKNIVSWKCWSDDTFVYLGVYIPNNEQVFGSSELQPQKFIEVNRHYTMEELVETVSDRLDERYGDVELKKDYLPFLKECLNVASGVQSGFTDGIFSSVSEKELKTITKDFGEILSAILCLKDGGTVVFMDDTNRLTDFEIWDGGNLKWSVSAKTMNIGNSASLKTLSGKVKMFKESGKFNHLGISQKVVDVLDVLSREKLNVKDKLINRVLESAKILSLESLDTMSRILDIEETNLESIIDGCNRLAMNNTPLARKEFNRVFNDFRKECQNVHRYYDKTDDFFTNPMKEGFFLAQLTKGVVYTLNNNPEFKLALNAMVKTMNIRQVYLKISEKSGLVTKFNEFNSDDTDFVFFTKTTANYYDKYGVEYRMV